MSHFALQTALVVNLRLFKVCVFIWSVSSYAKRMSREKFVCEWWLPLEIEDILAYAQYGYCDCNNEKREEGTGGILSVRTKPIEIRKRTMTHWICYMCFHHYRCSFELFVCFFHHCVFILRNQQNDITHTCHLGSVDAVQPQRTSPQKC